MPKMLALSTLTLSVMLVAPSSHAAQNVYVSAYTGAPAATGLIVDTPAEELVGDFGGAEFDAAEGQPVSIAIADASGGVAAWTVAQDLDGDSISGEAGLEPNISGCGNGGSLVGSAIAFVDGAPINVFLRSAGRVSTVTATFTPCAGVVTHGTITLTTEVAE